MGHLARMQTLLRQFHVICMITISQYRRANNELQWAEGSASRSPRSPLLMPSHLLSLPLCTPPPGCSWPAWSSFAFWCPGQCSSGDVIAVPPQDMSNPSPSPCPHLHQQWQHIGPPVSGHEILFIGPHSRLKWFSVISWPISYEFSVLQFWWQALLNKVKTKIAKLMHPVLSKIKCSKPCLVKYHMHL